jgi:hypothetical protein
MRRGYAAGPFDMQSWFFKSSVAPFCVGSGMINIKESPFKSVFVYMLPMKTATTYEEI